MTFFIVNGGAQAADFNVESSDFFARSTKFEEFSGCFSMPWL
jgi:hypothetical protein